MSEEISVEENLGKCLADKISKMNKTELVNALVVQTLRSRVQDENITALEGIEQNLVGQLEEGIILRKSIVSELETKLDKAEAYVEQGRAMIEAVMQRWYEYDV